MFVATPAESEYRSYRRVVSWSVLGLIVVGSSWVLGSVAWALYQRRTAGLPARPPVSDDVTAAELRGCLEELGDARQALERHLESFHHLLGGYDQGEAQRWSDEGAVWRRQWAGLGKGCRFPTITTRRFRKEMEELAAAHEELGAIEAQYTRELLRFGREQVPRLDRVRARIEAIGRRLETTAR